MVRRAAQAWTRVWVYITGDSSNIFIHIIYWDFQRISGLGGYLRASQQDQLWNPSDWSPGQVHVHSQPGREPKGSWLAPAEKVPRSLTFLKYTPGPPRFIVRSYDLIYRNSFSRCCLTMFNLEMGSQLWFRTSTNRPRENQFLIFIHAQDGNSQTLGRSFQKSSNLRAKTTIIESYSSASNITLADTRCAYLSIRFSLLSSQASSNSRGSFEASMPNSWLSRLVSL